MTAWIIKMKFQWRDHDLGTQLWEEGLVGIRHGHWTVADVVAKDGRITTEAVDALDEDLLYKPASRSTIRMFLCDAEDGDIVVWPRKKTIHLGRLDGQARDYTGFDPRADDGGDPAKVRPLRERKTFRLDDLPSGYRLLPTAQRGTFSRTHAYRDLVEIAAECDDASEVRQQFSTLSIEEFLPMLSAKSWETLCDQFLRDEVGLRSLVLQPGGTLKDDDIIGVDEEGKLVVAQCKNDSNPRSAASVERWRDGHAAEARCFYFARGGVDGEVNAQCEVVDGAQIVRWLKTEPRYAEALRTL